MTFERYIQHLIETGVIPGISILIGKGEDVVFNKHYGCKSIKPEKEGLTEHTLYDTASLTKPLITAFAAVSLMERKEIALDGGSKKYFPALPFDIQILQLLTHTSGLPNWFPFYLYGNDYFSRFKSLRLESRPGRRVNYSCVGYILLYFLIQKVTGTDFKEFIQELIFTPLRLKETFLKVPEDLKKRAAPTEEGNLAEKKMAGKKYPHLANRFKWRDYVIQGETHDANSYYLGGTAGNAGLFSTAKDLFRLSLEFFPSTCTIIKPDSARLFWQNFTPGRKSHRTVGFKRNSSFFTSGGTALSKEAIGHNGFTGTSLWFDPHSEYKYIFLSNRIHPRVQEVNFDRIRRKLLRLIKKDLGLA